MTPDAPAGVYSKHRVEALNDGIYAVAMTLLVLELKLPELPGVVNDATLGQALLHLIPKFVAWLISFFILAVFWMSHQRAFHYVRAVEPKLLWINVVALMLASLLPFSSALIGEYGALFTSQVVYAANMAALSLACIWQLDHLEKHPELCQPSPFPHAVARGARFRCWSLAGVAAIAVVIASIDPRFGSFAFMSMILFGRIGRRIEAREAARAALLSSDRPFP